MTWLIQKGGKLTDDWLQKYTSSPQWKNQRFQNPKSTLFTESKKKSKFQIFKIIVEQFFTRTKRKPDKPVEVQPFDKAAFLQGENLKYIWYTHSAVLLRMNQTTILTDPMFGKNASPLLPFKLTNRFTQPILHIIDDLPEIDIVLITHDHYDHLDYHSIQKLKHKTRQFYVPLGVSRHLLHWGIAREKMTEFDWWQNITFNNIEFTFTPTRHFSGRVLKDRGLSLWGGWSLKSSKESVYISGDGGYDKHFKDIGEKLGPFDLAFVECGQYSRHWPQVHLFPEESVQAAIDVKAKTTVPVHWSAFVLAQHPWDEPVKRFNFAANKKALNIVSASAGKLHQI